MTELESEEDQTMCCIYSTPRIERLGPAAKGMQSTHSCRHAGQPFQFVI